ncbi:hypothetical protein V8E53_014900 [Lactarius tabidus]
MTKRSCLVCGTPAANWCAGCKSATYCNKEHQKQDWRSHKEYCQKVKAAGANTFDAILFAVNETKPRLVKIPWKISRVHEDGPTLFHDLDTDIWFKHTDKSMRDIKFNRWGINGPGLGRMLCFIYDDNFSINGLPLNRCIVHVTGGGAGHQWRGNILALRMKNSQPYSGFYADVDMKKDLKAFVTYFEEYGKVTPV